MEVIINFKSDLSVANQLAKTVDFFKRARLRAGKSHSVIMAEAKEYGAGLNMVVFENTQNITYQNFIVLCDILFCEFTIYNEEGNIITTSHYKTNSIKLLLEHFKRLRKNEDQSYDAFAKKLGLGSYTVFQWETKGGGHVRLKTIFTALQSLHYKIIIKNEI